MKKLSLLLTSVCTWGTLFLIIFFNEKLHAYLVPDNSSYKIHKEANFQYILPEENLKQLDLIKYYSDFITPIYEADFKWQLDERTSIVLASKNNQIPNAFAMTTPNNLTVYYSGGVEFLESSASSSWIYILSTHERAHIYQLNAKQSPSRELKYLFGNDPLVFIPFVPIPIFISPNQFLPSFIVEGNAVLNESRFQQGGRLYSGEARATVASLVFSDKADLKFLMNEHLYFPFGNDKYLVGGYFQNYLSQLYGIKKVNSFFIKNANRYLNPFYLKTSFSETFYKSYETLYQEFLSAFKNQHATFKRVNGTQVATSLAEIYFNRSLDESQVLFSTQPTGKSRKRLFKISTTDLSVSNEPTLLKSGKIFELDFGKYASNSSDYINQTKYLYSLFDDNQASLPDYEGKYTHDLKGKFHSYFLMSASIDTGELFLNDHFIAKTESKSLLDRNGNIYYFKQNKNFRELYKNTERLVSFEGYYSLLQDVISENEIYFTANTANGTSLYCFCQQKIQKIFNADNISRALKINNRFLVSAIESDGYHVYIADADSNQIQQPEVYTYQSLTEKMLSHDEAIHSSMSPIESKSQNNNNSDKEFSNYLSLREMRFNRFLPTFYSDEENYLWINQLGFIDPLFWSSLDFAFSVSDTYSYNFLNYNYSPYLIDFSFRVLNTTENGRTDTDYRLALEYPLFENPFHKFTTSLVLNKNFLGNKETDDPKVYFNYTYTESYLLNYLPYRYLGVQPSVMKIKDTLVTSFLVEFSYYLGADFYLSGGYNYYQTKEEKIISSFVKDTKYKNTFPLLAFSPSFLVENLEQSQLELLKEIPYSAYYYRFPISVRRVAPYIGYQDNKSYVTTEEYLKEQIVIYKTGLEVELLLFHRIPSRVRIMSAEVESQHSKENIFSLTLQQEY